MELIDCDNMRKIEGLFSLAKLRKLDVRRFREVEYLPSIEKLVYLEELWAYGCVKLKSIRGLEHATKLRLLKGAAS